MQGGATQLLSFLEGVNNRYIIPVYQRSYDWRIENCKQLYNDLLSLIKDNRENHFFGSIVSEAHGVGSNINIHIIDGQQRLTTITLLLLAISNLIKKGELESNYNDLANQILEVYIISKWAEKDNMIKLIPIEKDREALKVLILGSDDEYIQNSNLTINYNYFYDRIKKDFNNVDEFYDAIKRLQIISISLDKYDDAQLIFESLNSTGLALSEGDKIRNFILMNLSPAEQVRFYDNYWVKIDKFTKKNIDSFVRNYMSIKTNRTPTMSKVYMEFKNYVNKSDISLEDLLKDMLRYSKFYEKLLDGKSGLDSKNLDRILFNLKRLEITVTEPFFMEIFNLNDKGELSTDELVEIFKVVESYLFRRNICDVATNALNKIFLNLNREILRYDGTCDDYVEKLNYNLMNKRDSGRFPDDDEFYESLDAKQVYLMRGRYKNYLFNKFENFNTVETKDVYNHLDEGTYSIEHIMPQKLNKSWIDELGENAEEIHDKWIHKLGNLTLTGYNSDMSNSSFEKKRDAEHGFKNSGLRMNQGLALIDSWNEDEIIKRHKSMLDMATNEIWRYPISNFKPKARELDYCSLADEEYNLSGRNLVKINFRGDEIDTSTWVDAFITVIRTLHEEDKSILIDIANRDENDILSYSFSISSERFNNFEKIDDNIFANTNSSTNMKVKILRELFELYDEDLENLVFYLGDRKSVVSDKFLIKEEYWSYALPIIKEKNEKNNLFTNVNKGSGTWIIGSFGIGGFGIFCWFYRSMVKVSMILDKSDKEYNKAAFDYLFKDKEEIENNLGFKLSWNKLEDKKLSRIDVVLEDENCYDKSNWDKYADFQAEMSDKLYNELVPRLREFKNMR
ncbi:DUF4268 domain-containing protein [Peptoniphilus sp. MSJ-1]|uniref:DUF4268 domain-containing protein n=1 Tax=Peptoniphilus ovalis TaxID=2841503 RepID=A0ABS6FEH8_9FIRM|nr:DUF4268 domain-containing protein [Peptoniphilus ovalis]MBU5668589.1 DUF4268 domain-containing protein [Peptoniphilus ovalis]